MVEITIHNHLTGKTETFLGQRIVMVSVRTDGEEQTVEVCTHGHKDEESVCELLDIVQDVVATNGLGAEETDPLSVN